MTKISHDSEVPAKGQQVLTACAAIHRIRNDKPEIFVAKRAATKQFLPDVFELPGGHIDFGEELTDGLQREIMEEFGVHISVGAPFAAFTYVNEIKQSHSVEVIYFATLLDDEATITLHPEDHSEYRWVNTETIKAIYTEQKNKDNIEYVCLRQGLDLLSGGKINFGN